MTKHSTDYFIDLLPGVPVIESPFFQNIVDAGYFSDDERRVAVDLHENGYAVIDFPDSEILARAERISMALRPLFDAARYGDNPYGATLSPPRFQDAYRVNADVKAIAVNAAIIELLSKLYGRRAFPFQTLNFEKGSQQPVHSDAVHFHSYPEKYMCGVWVALEDMTLENGPLHYYPGSHKWGSFANEHVVKSSDDLVRPATQHIYHQMWNALLKSSHAEKQIFLAKKGQALIWCANMLHGGEKVLDNSQSRWSQVTHYFFENCAYYTPLSSHLIAGKISFRKPCNIATLQTVAPSYSGITLPTQYVDNMRNSQILATGEVIWPAPPTFGKRLQRVAKKLLGALRDIQTFKS